ncbi:MAG: heavy metal-responsive transcriptional regulator [Micromonosporaceae bacterium]
MSTTITTGPGLRVGELAAVAGVAPDTVRYYERAGLLPPPRRTPAGYRVYDAGAVDRMRFIQGAQRLGLRLRDIANLLAVRDTGVCPCEPAEELLRRRLVELDAEMARLAALRAEMVAMINALPSAECPPPAPGVSWCPPDGEGGECDA